MGLMDQVKGLFKHKDKAVDLAAEHGDKITDGVDKATDVVDDKTGGKYTEHLDTADEKVSEVVEGLGDSESDSDSAADTDADSGTAAD
jgi:hypothetical protein